MDKVGLLFFPAFDWSLGCSHPEREERLLYTRDQIFEEGILDIPGFSEYSPRLAGITDIVRTHAIFPTPGSHISPPHRIAAGGALVLADAVMKGDINRGFALVRPPGHHAMHTVFGNRGFCTLNNVAILVNYLRKAHGVRRIAIVDTDVHHGDGTQDIFYHDPEILFISIHQDGKTLYPGSGFPEERGGPQAFDTTLNIPLPPGTGDDGLLFVLEELVLPALDKFKPELIINSAGQDNHFTDPLASMHITASGYGKLTEYLKPDLAVLEGGYAIETALPYVNLAILLAMAGLDYSGVEPPVPTLDNIPLKSIKAIVHTVKQRRELSHPRKDWYHAQKQVYYDTEQLWESKLHMVKGCSECSGVQLTQTGADCFANPKPDNLVIKLPFGVCPNCRTEAEKTWEKVLRQRDFRVVFWQDQAQDKFIYHDGKLREIDNDQTN